MSVSEKARLQTVATEFAKRSDLESFVFREGVNVRETAIIILAIGVPFAAAVMGGAMGWLWAAEWMEPKRPEISFPMMLLGFGLAGSLVGWYILDMVLSASEASYEASTKPGQMEPTGRSFVPDARNPRRLVDLRERDKQLLQTFARSYPTIKTLGVNEWEGDGSPLVFDWISKRDAIKRIQAIVINQGHGRRDNRGGVQVVDPIDFEGRIIPLWQNGQFEVEDAD